MPENAVGLCSPLSVVPFGRLSLRTPKLLLDVDGQAVGARSGKVLKGYPNPQGYLQVSYTRDGRKRSSAVHVLVCEAFHGPRPEGMVVRHRNGNNQDNRPANLCWGTPEENQADRTAHGGDMQGERNGNAILTTEDIHTIRDLLRDGVLQRDVAERFGVSAAKVSQIHRGIAWAHVPERRR